MEFGNFYVPHYDNVKLSVIKIIFFIIIANIVYILCIWWDRGRKEEAKREKDKKKSLCRSLNSFIIAHFFRLSSFYALEKKNPPLKKKEIFYSLLCVWCVLKLLFTMRKHRRISWWKVMCGCGSKRILMRIGVNSLETFIFVM